MALPAEALFDTTLKGSDVNITDLAGEKLIELLKDAGDELTGIRIFVSGGGCSGMQYGMTFAEGAGDHDAILTGDGYDVYVDSIALSYLRGVEIDYVEKDMNGSFVFNNVFASTGGSGACGACGANTGPGGGGGGCA